MKKSDSIKELAAALSAAQAELKPAEMNVTNPFLKKKYADLGAVIEASRPVLAKNGLSVSQPVESCDDRIGVTTILLHTSGEWIESTTTLQIGDERGKSNAQVAGSIISYLRRYSLASILGMYAGDDVDGVTTVEQAKKPVKIAEQPEAQPEPNGKSTTAMSLKMAESVTNSEGVAYGTLDTEKLTHMYNAMGKLKDKTEEHQLKMDAIRVILASRAKS